VPVTVDYTSELAKRIVARTMAQRLLVEAYLLTVIEVAAAPAAPEPKCGKMVKRVWRNQDWGGAPWKQSSCN
jgi:hypothetical protein